MKLKEAIGVLKKWGSLYDGTSELLEWDMGVFNKAIDTVIEELEKPYPTDEEISEAATNHYVWGQREPIGSRERATHETKKESFVAGATWMRDLIERRAK